MMRADRLRHPARLAGASLMRLQSDERLAGLAVDGHEAAFAAIVDRYRGPLLRYCAGIVGADRAEDAVQQVFINAHDALANTSDVRHLRSWLYRIAHNASLNVLRAVRDDVELDPDQAAASAEGPAAAFERTERLRATLDAVRDLPERQRAALVLRELEGRSHDEIAAALGVTPGSARQHLMRARIAVRGAVTAITPYPLVAKLSDLVAGPATSGWTDAAIGAGTTATLAKLTAGVMATTALVGGAERTVHHHHQRSAAAHERAATAAPHTDVAALVRRAARPLAAAAQPRASLIVEHTTDAAAVSPTGPRPTDAIGPPKSTGTNDSPAGPAPDDHSGPSVSAHDDAQSSPRDTARDDHSTPRDHHGPSSRPHDDDHRSPHDDHPSGHTPGARAHGPTSNAGPDTNGTTNHSASNGESTTDRPTSNGEGTTNDPTANTDHDANGTTNDPTPNADHDANGTTNDPTPNADHDAKGTANGPGPNAEGTGPDPTASAAPDAKGTTNGPASSSSSARGTTNGPASSTTKGSTARPTSAAGPDVQATTTNGPASDAKGATSGAHGPSAGATHGADDTSLAGGDDASSANRPSRGGGAPPAGSRRGADGGNRPSSAAHGHDASRAERPAGRGADDAGGPAGHDRPSSTPSARGDSRHGDPPA